MPGPRPVRCSFSTRSWQAIHVRTVGVASDSAHGHDTTSTAIAAATDRLLRRGALAVKPHVLETLGRATHVVFDKTGTLTYGHPVLRQTVTFGGASRRMALQLAAALE
ncbi:hypothetical protein ACEN88_34840, partial [Massilia sp. CT11-108]|uniref:hypothetical protein n=1 Tax=Massilia sp. CT11-108 TaxID=3393900 RepID=UPI0039A4B2D8